MGADFWTIAGEKGLWGDTPFCRYPEASAKQLNICYAAILAPGTNGPVATTRLEAIREGVQECEARMFIEEALAGEQLSQELVERTQSVLDERTRILRLLNLNERGMELWHPGSGWQKRSCKLYEIATEVATAIDNRVKQNSP